MISVRKILLLILGLILVCLSPRTFATQLKAATAQAFQQYIDLTEARIRGEVCDPNRFLQFDSLPGVQRVAVLSRLRKGAVLIEPVTARKNEASIEIPGGLVHHWLAIGFIPGVTVDQVLTLAQDYPRYAEIYKPDVQRTDIISHEGQQFRVYYRFYRHAIVTVVFNTEFVIDYSTPDSFHAYSFARTVRIAEVENPGKTNEREYPVGNDHGYLWRFNLYTRYLERDNGVYIQIEFLALSRTVPAIFTWLVNPYLRSIPREYLTQYVRATRTALTPSNAHPSGVGRRQSEPGGSPTKRAVHFLGRRQLEHRQDCNVAVISIPTH
jgi:hypothetical protein